MKALGYRDYRISTVVNIIGVVAMLFRGYEIIGITVMMIEIVYESFYIENEDKLVNIILYYFNKLAPLIILSILLIFFTFSFEHVHSRVYIEGIMIPVCTIFLRTWSAYKDRKRIKEKIASQNQEQS